MPIGVITKRVVEEAPKVLPKKHIEKYTKPKPTPTYARVSVGRTTLTTPLVVGKDIPKPEPVKEEPSGVGFRRKPHPLEGKTIFTLPEYQTELSGTISTGIKEFSKSFKAEKEFKSEIIPTETYRVPMIGGRHVSQKELDVYQKTKPPDWTPQYQVFTGAELIALGGSQYAKYREDISTQIAKTQKHLTETKEWHPTTKAIRTDIGFKIEFPYPGAEKYRTYERDLKKSGFLGLFATALTPEDPLGLTSAYYTAIGEEQKALDVKIKALHGVSTIKSPLDFGKFWIESPLTQIGLITAGAPLVTKGVAYTSGMAKALWGVKGAFAVKSIAAVGAGALITKEAFDIKGEFEVGRPGEAMGRAGVLGLSLVGAYAGYKSVSPKVKAGLYEAGQLRVLSKQLPFIKKGALTKFQWGMPGERMATISKYQEYSVRGVPIERTKYGLTEITAWKPPSKALRISFPEHLDKMTMGKALFAPTRWIVPQKALYISFPGTKGLEVGPTLRGLGLGTGKVRGITVSDMVTKPLLRGKEFRLFRYLSPKIKGRIYTAKHGEFTDIKMLTMKEAYGYGGISQSFQETIPKSVFKPEMFDIPIFGKGEISPSLFAPTVFPSYKQERRSIFVSEIDIKEISSIIKTSIVKLQMPFKATPPIKDLFTTQELYFEETQEISPTQIQTQMQKQMQESLFKQVYKKPPISRKRPPYFVEEPFTGGFPFFFMPIHLAGRGRKQYDYGLWKELYGFRKAKTYDPLKELMGGKQTKTTTRTTTRKARAKNNLLKELW